MLPLRRIFECSSTRSVVLAGLITMGLAGVAACAKTDNAPPVATPTFSASKARIALGSPVDFTFQFDVMAPIAGDYRVLMHVVNPDGDTIWIDDHEPSVPTSQWKPGQKIRYTRQQFLPVIPFTGEAIVRVGLYKGDQRLPLQGADPNQRTYKIGTLQLLPQTENIFVIYKSGWNSTEFTPDNAREWQWTQKSATVNFKNPRKDVTLYLEFDARPDLFTPPQQVALVVAGKTVKTLGANSATPALLRIPITAAELGADDMVELRLDVDRSFVPAKLPVLNSPDTRELGIRVYRFFVDLK